MIGDVDDVLLLAVIHHQAKSIALIARSFLHAPGEPLAVGRVERRRIATQAGGKLSGLGEQRVGVHGDHEDIVIGAGGFHFVVVAGEGYFLAVGRDGIVVLAAKAERRHVVIAGRDLRVHSATGRNDEEMRALKVGVVIPVPIEKPRKDHGLYLGKGTLLIFGFVAGVGAAFGIHLGDKENFLSIREPHGAISFRGYTGDLLGFAGHSAGGGIEVGGPHLRVAATRADEEEFLSIRRPAATGLARRIGSHLPRFTAGERNDPDMGGALVAVQIHVHR